MKRELEIEKRGGRIAHLMALVAGVVDAVGYIVLFRMFTANMSGNSVEAGIAISRGEWTLLAHWGLPILFFTIGVITGSFIIVLLQRRGLGRFSFSIIFALEAALIASFGAAGAVWYTPSTLRISFPYFYAVSALPATAMGLQTAVLHRVGSLSIRTTFVTGMLATACREGVNWLFWMKDRYRTGRMEKILRVSRRQLPFARMWITGGIWVFYMAGAILGSFLLLYGIVWALALPAGLLLAALAVNLLTRLEPN